MIQKSWQKVAGLLVFVMSFPLFPWRLRSAIFKALGANISEGSVLGHGCTIAGPLANLNVGRNAYINHSCFLGVEGKLCIGHSARIGPYVKIMTRSHPIEHSVIRRAPGKDMDLKKTIGDGVWVGLGAIILPGVDIAEGCVIGAGAVVVKSTSPNGLYVGCPAHRIRDLPVQIATQ